MFRIVFKPKKTLKYVMNDMKGYNELIVILSFTWQE